MTVTPAFFPLSVQILQDINACPVRGGNLYFYDAETTSLRAVYRDAALTLPHPSPVKTDAYGRIPVIWIGLGNYKVVIQDAVGAQISTIDDLPGGETVVEVVTPTSDFVTGDIKAAHANNTQDGWLPLNGQTIGGANTSATSRANVDTQALFILLWNQDPSLVVGGGRGITASADWAAAKTIALPDYRGRVFCGVDIMGAPTPADEITAATTPTPNTVGTKFGTETVGLSVSQLPAFTPAITIVNAGAHTHTGTTDSGGAHTHTGTTDTTGAHQHNYDTPTITDGVSGSSFGAVPGTTSVLTSLNGDHMHNLTIATAGAHTHTFTTDSDGDHTHTATAAAIGGGTAHSNTQPTIMGYWLIKL